MTNELTTNVQFKVDFKASEITIQNESQLKEMVDKAVNHYSSMIFTDANIPEAKQAKADLNKVATLLDNERKAIKNEYNKPLKSFEDKIKTYVGQIKLVSDGINESIQLYEETERSKRLEKIKDTIKEMSENYSVEVEEVGIRNNWLNKSSFTAKGEINKKTLEEIAADMTMIFKEKERVIGEKAIIENYVKALGLEPYSWLSQIDNGKTAAELMIEIDAALAKKKAAEERAIEQQKAHEEYEAAMRELNETVVEDKVIDKNTGEIVSELSPKVEVEDTNKNTVTLRLSGSHSQLTALNEFIVDSGIMVEVIE